MRKDDFEIYIPFELKFYILTYFQHPEYRPRVEKS